MLKLAELNNLNYPHIKEVKNTKYGDIIFIDESKNTTGTHKDRMALSISMMYRKMIKYNDKLRLSIISSGSAAYAIQYAFDKLDLPPLKVLIDENRKEINILKGIGCEVYTFDLDSRILSTNDILKITNNIKGIDITSNMVMNPYTDYYHTLISNIASLDYSGYIFIPYGSGHLFGSFLNYNKFNKPSDIQFVGGVTHSKSSKADKLYAPYNPFSTIDENFINTKIALKEIGNKSAIIEFEETSLYEAMFIASQNGINVEPSALGGFASMIDMYKNKSINKKEKKMILLTGKSKVYTELLKEDIAI